MKVILKFLILTIIQFVNFLSRIIIELNQFMKENYPKNEFLEKHLVKLHQKNFTHFISAKLDNQDKIELILKKNENDKKFFIKININKKTIEDKDIKSINSNENDYSKSLFSKSSISDKIKSKASDFEDLINKIITKKFNDKKLIFLPNILFIL